MSDDQDGCEWVSVSSGASHPGSPGPKAVKRLCVSQMGLNGHEMLIFCRLNAYTATELCDESVASQNLYLIQIISFIISGTNVVEPESCTDKDGEGGGLS